MKATKIDIEVIICSILSCLEANKIDYSIQFNGDDCAMFSLGDGRYIDIFQNVSEIEKSDTSHD